MSPRDPLRQDYAMASAIAPAEYARPNRHERRREWALVPRAVRDQAPPRRLAYLPPRARALLNRDLTRRNDLDRALATARGLAADDPACARFQGRARWEQLDHIARKRHAAGLGDPAGALAAAIGNAVGAS